jgi:hypothetical protein
MSENSEITPEELPEDEIKESPSQDGLMEIEAGDKVILTEVAMKPEPGSDAGADLAETADEAVAGDEEIAEVKEPTRFQLFLRRALIWFGVVLAFFAAGFATFYFVLYQPKVAENSELQQTIEDFESQVAKLEEENAMLAEDSAALEAAEVHKTLLMVMVDTYDARYALGEENTVAAKSAFSGTNAALATILDEISDFDSGLAETLPQRLKLIQTNIDRDIETAIEDCDQLIEDLLAVEEALYP